MTNKYQENLLERINEINSIQNVSLKNEAIYKLISYITYIYYSKIIDQKQFIKILDMINNNTEEKEYEKERDKNTKELIENNILLKKFYRDFLIIYNKYIFNLDDVSFNKNIYHEFINFMKYMHCDKLYYDLLCNNNISFKSRLNHSVCINNRNDSYIIITENNPFDRYFVLTHEMGHAFENKIMKDELNYFDSPFNIEIFSILFNRIFIEYLYANNVLNNKELFLLKNNFEYNYYCFLHKAFLITEMIQYIDYNIGDYEISVSYNGKTYYHDLTDHNYAIGSIISLVFLNEWRTHDQLFIKKLPQLIQEVRHTKIDNLINNYSSSKIVESEIKRLIISKVP